MPIVTERSFMPLAASLEREGMPDRVDELARLLNERLDAEGRFTEDKEGENNCLILWAYLEIARLRGLFEALDKMDGHHADR
jgi:hypothetical protein